MRAAEAAPSKPAARDAAISYRAIYLPPGTLTGLTSLNAPPLPAKVDVFAIGKQANSSPYLPRLIRREQVMGLGPPAPRRARAARGFTVNHS